MITFTKPSEPALVWRPTPDRRNPRNESLWHLPFVIHRMRLPLTSPPHDPLKVTKCGSAVEMRSHGTFDKSRMQQPSSKLDRWMTDPESVRERKAKLSAPRVQPTDHPDELILDGEAGQQLGLTFTETTALSVDPGSLAERFGAQKFIGRPVTHVNGEAVSTHDELVSRASKTRPLRLLFGPLPDPEQSPPASEDWANPQTDPSPPPTSVRFADPSQPRAAFADTESPPPTSPRVLPSSDFPDRADSPGATTLQLQKEVGEPMGLVLTDDGVVLGVARGSPAERCGAQRMGGMRLVSADDDEPFSPASRERIRNVDRALLKFAPVDGPEGASASPPTQSVPDSNPRNICSHLSPPPALPDPSACAVPRFPPPPGPMMAVEPPEPPTAAVVPVPNHRRVGLSLQRRHAPGLHGRWVYVRAVAADSPFAVPGNPPVLGQFIYAIGGRTIRSKADIVDAFARARSIGLREVLCEYAAWPPAWLNEMDDYDPSEDEPEDGLDTEYPDAAPLASSRGRASPGTDALGLTVTAPDRTRTLSAVPVDTLGVSARSGTLGAIAADASAAGAGDTDSLFGSVAAATRAAVEPLHPGAAAVSPSFRTHRPAGRRKQTSLLVATQPGAVGLSFQTHRPAGAVAETMPLSATPAESERDQPVVWQERQPDRRPEEQALPAPTHRSKPPSDGTPNALALPAPSAAPPAPAATPAPATAPCSPATGPVPAAPAPAAPAPVPPPAAPRFAVQPPPVVPWPPIPLSATVGAPVWRGAEEAGTLATVPGAGPAYEALAPAGALVPAAPAYGALVPSPQPTPALPAAPPPAPTAPAFAPAARGQTGKKTTLEIDLKRGTLQVFGAAI
eukprot:TRINITY_DN13824_c0_g1_i2.p1 TRINITY_DN13824_c0_g1~~TRINITY_DN13824_c0_g1_i2.p1  ORF type:complete len:849 (+),score=157.31 TRINITY_DN13824_c0_g1_i2:421-2967(+)